MNCLLLLIKLWAGICKLFSATSKENTLNSPRSESSFTYSGNEWGRNTDNYDCLRIELQVKLSLLDW